MVQDLEGNELQVGEGCFHSDRDSVAGSKSVVVEDLAGPTGVGMLEVDLPGVVVVIVVIPSQRFVHDTI